VKIAGAPISWGVCEVPGWGYQLTPERVLAVGACLARRAVSTRVRKRDRCAAQHSARLVLYAAFHAAALLPEEALPYGQPHENRKDTSHHKLLR